VGQNSCFSIFVFFFIAGWLAGWMILGQIDGWLFEPN
jgi:hypothetical protein